MRLPEEISKKTFCVWHIAVVKATVSIKVSYTLIQASVSVAHEGRVEHFIRDPREHHSESFRGLSQIHFGLVEVGTVAEFEEGDTSALEEERGSEYTEGVGYTSAHLPF